MDRETLDRLSQSAALSNAGPGNTELLFLDGNSTFADADLDAGGLLPLLVKLIANHRSDDGENTDDQIENVTIYSLVTGLEFRKVAAKTN